MTVMRGRRALAAAACVLFLAYALCFLYFFVDDEAIPLVYASNLLRGRGLVYTVLEGRVEGYSDFLHVVWSTALLAVTRAFSWSRLTPLLIGKVVSLAAGTSLVAVTAAALSRLGIRLGAAAAALVFLALAGPLAVWSASSLETVVTALAVFAFALALWEEGLGLAVVLGTLVTLERIDGPIYVAIVAAAVFAGQPRRWRFLVRALALVATVGLAYHLWRLAYFGSLLSAPLASKVMYRLAAPPRAIVKAPNVTYLRGLVDIYGWAAVGLFAAAAVAAVRHAAGRAAIVAILLIGVYSERVDDWMFGWRFVVAAAPFAAVMVALAIDRLPRAAMAVAAAAVVIVSGMAALAFARSFEAIEGKPVFWVAPRRGEAAWLGRYHELLAAGRERMRSGDRIAFNQAGLLPYVLGLENIDDLGICSRFVARLPTTDVYFTGVGRYSPLSNAPAIRTAHAYLLYQNVKFLVSPADLLQKANGGTIPDELLDGAFARIPDPRLHENVLYRRTDKPEARFAHDPTAFTENVAHYSHIVQASIDGRPLDDNEIGPRLPFLREQTLRTRYDSSFSVDVTFARTPEAISQVYVGSIATSPAARLTIELRDPSGRAVFYEECPIEPAGTPLRLAVPAGTLATALSLSVHAPTAGSLRLSDLRVEGQTPALAGYIRRMLPFPSPQW